MKVPAEQRSPVPDAPTGPTDLCVTLVHGTWGSRAAWSGGGSPLWRELASAGARCERFAWSGRNSHHARRHAAEDLEHTLLAVSAARPETQHAIVAHSHGGNVALHAASRLACAGGPPVRVVTLATPFLFASSTRSTFPWHTSTLVLASVYAVAMVTARVAAPDLTFGSPATFPLAVLTLVVVALQAVSWVYFRRKHGRPGDPTTVDGVVSAIGSPAVAVHGGTHPVDLLVVRAADDEAGGLLGSAQFAGWVGFTAARLTRPDRLFALFSVVVFLLPNASLLTGDPGRLPTVVGVVLDWSFSVFFVLAMVMSIPALASIAYGLDGPAVSRFAVVTAEASPPGEATVWQRPIRESRAQGLAHSSLYDDEPVIQHVVEHVVHGTNR